MNFAKLAYFLRSRTTATLDNPNPINIHWPKSANLTSRDWILKAPVLEMNVVVKRAGLGIHVLNHHLMPLVGIERRQKALSHANLGEHSRIIDLRVVMLLPKFWQFGLVRDCGNSLEAVDADGIHSPIWI